MGCDFTEEVSLLVDGELAPHEAARLDAHIEVCAACRQARESFLLLRQELRSYDWTPDPNVQRAALLSIFNAPKSSRGRVSALPGRLAAAFTLRRLRPAHVFALALLITTTALGMLWLKGSHTSRQDARAVANTNDRPAQTASKAEELKSQNSDDVERPVVNHPEKKTPYRAGVRPNRGRRREALNREVLQEAAGVAEPNLPLPAATAVAVYAATGDPSLRIERHAERVERLLRSFRNARLTKGDPTLDVDEARRLSKRLLYSNIALRREAESAGDLPVEGLLDSVEPILIDISNLPDAPSPDAVGSIKERINRRPLVGALQAQGMQVSP